MQRGTCHACKQSGHWAKDCPDKQMNKLMPSSTISSFVNDQAIPDKQCPHCGRLCVVVISKTQSNPGRKIYKCPENRGFNNNFFQWCDEASPAGLRRDIQVSPKRNLMGLDKKQGSSQSLYPECSCGAGICELLTANSGRNKGKKYFVCPVKKGQGACNFFQWQDRPGIILNRYHVDVGENFDSPTSTPGSHEKMKTIHKDVTNSSDLENVNNNMNIKAPEKEENVRYEDMNKHVNGNPGMTSPGSAGKSLDKFSSVEHHVLNEAVGLDSEFDDVLINYLGDLDLKEKKTNFGANPRTCYQCGQGGHWISDCPNPINSICYKCGKVGHWTSDCAS